MLITDTPNHHTKKAKIAFAKFKVPYVAKNSRYCMYTFTEIHRNGQYIQKKEKHAVRSSPVKNTHLHLTFS
jgi:hypothetical protein